ncbi:hypothetical protein O1L60_41425 [Streptomyces diastatochromogenes]|nr:hypothetical protein [Streptomyces diastatochromogenes]
MRVREGGGPQRHRSGGGTGQAAAYDPGDHRQGPQSVPYPLRRFDQGPCVQEQGLGGPQKPRGEQNRDGVPAQQYEWLRPARRVPGQPSDMPAALTAGEGRARPGTT